MSRRKSKVYRQGDRGRTVAWYQKWLYKRGFYKYLPWKQRITVWNVMDGDFGPKTKEAVRRFQLAAHIMADGIIGKQTKTAMNNWGRKPSRVVRKILETLRGFSTRSIWAYVFYHYTVTADGEELTPKRLCAMHQARGWRKGGYHGLIQPDGRLDTGDQYPDYLRKSDEIGAHARWWNRKALGYAWVGRTSPTDEQMKTMKALTHRLRNQGNGKKGFFGHGEKAATKCPGKLDMNSLRSF